MNYSTIRPTTAEPAQGRESSTRATAAEPAQGRDNIVEGSWDLLGEPGALAAAVLAVHPEGSVRVFASFQLAAAELPEGGDVVDLQGGTVIQVRCCGGTVVSL